MTEKHRFTKTNGSWYIDLPAYPGPKADLLMVEGADTTLDVMAGEKESIELLVSLIPEANFDELVKLEKNDFGSGAHYLMKTFNGNPFNKEMWLCDVTQYVFGNFPEKIYIRMVL